MVKVSPLSPNFGLLVEAQGDISLESLDLVPYFEQFCKPEGGVLLFRGFSGDLHSFKKITEAYGKDFKVAYTNLDERGYPDGDYSLATVNHGNYAIDFHTETNIPYSAEVFWMYCVNPSKDRGRTGIVDGVKVLNALTYMCREHFEKEGGYSNIENVTKDEWQIVFPDATVEQVKEQIEFIDDVFDYEFDEEESLSFKFKQTPIKKSKFCNLDVFVARILDWPEHVLKSDGEQYEKHVIKEVNQAVYQNALWIDWQQGDFVIINNTRVMHAREAFEDSQRRILVRYSNLADDVLG
jgi:hypothetical protein